MLSWLLFLAAAIDPLADYRRDVVYIQGQTWLPTTFFATVATIDDEEARADAIAALKFCVASASPQRAAERCTPQRVTPTLYRFDLGDLKWIPARWKKLLDRHNPYGGYTRLVRADWLVSLLASPEANGAYYELLYNLDPAQVNFRVFVDRWKVVLEPSETIGFIERRSSVQRAKVRFLENWPTRGRLVAWGTRNLRALTLEADPLEKFASRDFRFHDRELIAPLEKIETATGKSGQLNAYLIVDSEGKLEHESTLGFDRTLFRGAPTVRNFGSCASCHLAGFNIPSEDDFRESIRAGVIFSTNDPEGIAAFYRDFSKLIESGRESYADGIEVINGLAPEENREAFINAVNRYDEDLTLERASQELYTSPQMIKAALEASRSVPARIAALMKGRPIPRQTWEGGAWLSLKTILKEGGQ